MLSWVEHGKGFIILGPGLQTMGIYEVCLDTVPDALVDLNKSKLRIFAQHT